MKPLMWIAGVFLAFLAFVYIPFVHYQDAYDVAIIWNRVSGETSLETRAGIHFSAPWVSASKIDIRPVRVGVPSTGKGFSYKLVRFSPSAYREFIAMEGVRYYWLDNRFSFNSGYSEEHRGVKDLLRGYAYSGKVYPFLEVVIEESK